LSAPEHELRVTMPVVIDTETLIAALAAAVISHADELTALDRAIGDGDHGLNMRRGFEAVLNQLPSLTGQPLPEALKAMGMTLVMTVGGASGPLYGTLFLQLGKELPPEANRQELCTALAAALTAVKLRGKSERGQKTMIDALEPALEAFQQGKDPVAAALNAAEATIPMQAQRGRAAFLGERSIGHMDPGARSSALLIAAAAAVAAQQP